MLFSIGVLLPLMVGSFLPMLSWDMWATVDGAPDASSVGLSNDSLFRTLLVMNVLFPGVALLIAMDAVSRHPVQSGRGPSRAVPRAPRALALAGAAIVGLAGFLGSSLLAEGTERLVALTLSAVIPAAAYLMISGDHEPRPRATVTRDSAEDELFSIGARLVEGDNLESAVRQATGRPPMPLWQEGAGVLGSSSSSEGIIAEASRVVARAASKNEAQAGILAMDLSRYIKDLSELDLTLRRRLRPTVSMMRLTSHVLAPLMLGITYAIYLSLASIGDGSALEPGTLLPVLGAFLVEMNSVVAYFVWGIGERQSLRQLRYSVGACVLVATLIYAATVLVVC
jgi:hypothetical protein